MFVYENARQPHNRNVGKTDTKFTAMPMHVYSESLGSQTASSRRVQEAWLSQTDRTTIYNSTDSPSPEIGGNVAEKVYRHYTGRFYRKA